MPHRPGRLARLAAAASLAAMMLPAMAAPVGAADAITLEARALVGGRFEANGWIGIAATLSNGGSPVTGYLAADGIDGTVRRFVELPAGAHKLVTIYVRPAPFVRTIALRFESAEGKSLATSSADARVLERTSGHVAIVGDGGGNLRPQLIARGGGFPEPIPLTPADLTERPEPLRGIETIVWAADSSGLTEAQRRSLERWVAAGGQLVVLGGPDWQARTAAFGSLLPVERLASSDGSSAATLAAWAGAGQPDGGDPLTVAAGDLRPGAISLVRDAAGQALFASISRGAGRVSFVGIDLATEPFRTWAGAPALWTRLIPDDRIFEQWGGGGGPADDEVANAMSVALSRIPSLAVPPAELLLAVIVGYILLIGPLSYLVLRRYDRRELAWIVAPVLALVFSGVSYSIGLSMKGSQIIVNEISVVRTSTEGTAASVSTFAGISSPARATYDLTVRGDALLSALAANSFDPTFGGAVLNYATEQGDPAHLRGLAVPVSGQQAVRAEAVVPHTPALRVTWSLTATDLEGRATNEGTEPMEDVAVISRERRGHGRHPRPRRVEVLPHAASQPQRVVGLAAGVWPLCIRTQLARRAHDLRPQPGDRCTGWLVPRLAGQDAGRLRRDRPRPVRDRLAGRCVSAQGRARWPGGPALRPGGGGGLRPADPRTRPGDDRPIGNEHRGPGDRWRGIPDRSRLRHAGEW